MPRAESGAYGTPIDTFHVKHMHDGPGSMGLDQSRFSRKMRERTYLYFLFAIGKPPALLDTKWYQIPRSTNTT